uniref:Uncharacterized protein moxS n=1 Tax=Hyphomicrobium denitrificans TaxID=53399 RepID=Q4AE21_9HYPH|nr:hypothetical protein [Hyphomicrobium denitrificans]
MANERHSRRRASESFVRRRRTLPRYRTPARTSRPEADRNPRFAERSLRTPSSSAAFEQPSAIDVAVLADVSTSMGHSRAAATVSVAADLAQTGSPVCAERAGDTSRLLTVRQYRRREDLRLQRTHSRAAHSQAIEKLRAFTPEKPGVSGVLEAATAVSGTRRLVFLVSDFLWSTEDARRAGEALAFHDVVPVEIDDSLQLDELPDWGLLNLRDLETGSRRLVAMRPSLKARWQAARQNNERARGKSFDTTAREMFTIRDRIDWMRLTSFLLYGSV